MDEIGMENTIFRLAEQNYTMGSNVTEEEIKKHKEKTL